MLTHGRTDNGHTQNLMSPPPAVVGGVVSEQTLGRLNEVVMVDTKPVFNQVVETTASELIERWLPTQNVNLFQLTTTSSVV